ncbi:hypothetical protein AB0C08_39860, partial [Microbispora bryophytorum]|uniref:hypothetical protein n=1 Tax=Microbispora bryophytorum TaxID=1460882 RepID=UPI0033DB15E8
MVAMSCRYPGGVRSPEKQTAQHLKGAEHTVRSLRTQQCAQPAATPETRFPTPPEGGGTHQSGNHD